MPTPPDDDEVAGADGSEPDEDDHALARRIATEAGTLLLALRAHLGERGVQRWQVMDEGDAQAHHFLARRLLEARPDDPVLSEEGRDGPARLASDRVWIIDPLDGTHEYGEPGRPDWAVHVALSVRGRLAAGAVALPAFGVTYATAPAPVLPPMGGRRPRIVTSRWHPPYAAIVIAETLGCDVLRIGSAGAKAMSVVRGDADIWAHSGGHYEWDAAAPAAVARAAGLHVSRLDGSELVFNKPDPWASDVLICRPELRDAVLEALWG